MKIITMKKKRIPKERKSPRQKEQEKKNRDTVLWILSASFLIGGILGYWTAGKLPAEETILRFLQSAQQEAIQPALWREVWVIFRWPALVVALSLLPFAGRTIPLLMFLRGFTLSYGISALVAGAPGVWCAGLLYGPACLLTVPVLFVLAEEGLLRKAGEDSSPSSLPLRTAVCLPVLALCVFLNQTAIPPLLTWYLSS